MEKDKKVYIKWMIAIFCGLMLASTVIARTIGDWLLPVVHISQASSGTLERRLTQNGIIGRDQDLVKKEQIGVWSPVQGVITGVYKNKGELVRKGDVLIEFENLLSTDQTLEKNVQIKELEVKKNTLQRECEAITTQSAEIEEKINILKQKYDQITQEADILELKMTIDEKTAQQLIKKELYESGIISKGEYQNDITSIEKAKIRYEDAISNKKEQLKEDIQYEHIKQRDIRDRKIGIQEQIDSIEQQQLLHQTKEEIKQYDFLADETIIAPIDGVIMQINIEPNMFIREGEQILTIVPTDIKMIATWDVEIEQALWIEVGDHVEIQFNDSQEEGRVLSKQFKEADQKYQFKASINQALQEETGLEFNEYIPCKIKLSQKSKQYEWIIPMSAIVEEMGRTYIYVAEEYQSIWGKKYKVSRISVELLDDDNYYAAVEMLIPKDTQIIIETSEVLKDGMNVRIE